MADNAKKIKITLEDVDSAGVTQIVERLEEAKSIPLIRPIGESRTGRDAFVTIAALLGGGLVGGLGVFLLWQSGPVVDIEDSTTANLVASFSLTLVTALFIALADGALSRSLLKMGRNLLIAIPVGVVLALMLGFVANAFYSSAIDNLYQSLLNSGLDPSTENFWENFTSKNHLNRAVAWGLLGIAAGVAVGAPSLAIRRIAVTAGGGLIGGFIGGFAFDFITGGSAAQAIGLCITGAAIGLSMSILEQATKSSWLEITKGGMAGKQFILYQSTISLGSSPAAHVTLIKDPAIPPFAAEIKKTGSRVSIHSTDPKLPLQVNGVSAVSHALTEGSVILLGGTELRFREKSKKIKDSRKLKGF